MLLALYAQPGQTINLIAEILDNEGYRTDGYTSAPIVDSFLNSSFQEAMGFPSAMTRLSQGLWYKNITLNKGITSIGNYLANISWQNIDGYVENLSYLICVNAAFGQVLAIPG